MIRKTTVLTILLLLTSSVSADSFKTKANIRAISSSIKAESDANGNLTGDSASDGKIRFYAKQTGGKTGFYKYKRKASNHEISVQELGENKLRVALDASYEYEINGDRLANVGEAKGIATLKGDTAVLVPEDVEGCELTLKFSGNKIIVESTGTDFSCGFGKHVYAGGIYTKVSGKPAFGDSDEDSTLNNQSSSEQQSKPVRIRFAKGKSSVTVSGRITRGKPNIYVIGARAGQTLEIKITEGGENYGVVFSLTAPDGSNLMSEDPADGYDSAWRGKLTKSGDYKIDVGAIESVNVNFKMSVSIR